MAIGYPQHLSDEELRLAVLNGGRAPTPGFTAPQGLRPAFVPPAPVRPQPAPVAASPPEAQLADPAFRAYLDQQGAPKGKKPARDDFDQGRGWIAGLSTFFGGAQGSGEIADRWERDAERRDAQDTREIQERKAAALSDPASEQSAAMRQRMGPVLMQMGLKPEEVAGLSAADINQIGAGNLVTGLAAARQKSEAARAAAEAEKAKLVEGRTYTEGRDKAKTEAEQAEWDRRNGVTSPQRMQEAALTGGMSLDRAKQLSDYSEQKRIAAEGRKAAAEEAKRSATGSQNEAAMTNFEAANKRLFVSDPGTFAEINANTRARTQRQQVLSTASRALAASERLQEIDSEYAAIPLMERTSDKARALSSEYDQLKNEHQGIILKIAGSGGGTEADRNEIKEGLPSLYNPLAHARLQGIESMLRLNVEATLAPYGIGVLKPGEDRPPRVPEAKEGRGAEPDADADDSMTNDEERKLQEELGL